MFHLVPMNYPEDQALANFVATTRHKRKDGRLSKQEIEKLDEIGFIWQVRKDYRETDQSWEEHFSMLKKEENVNSVDPINSPTLASWIQTQQADYRRGDIPSDRKEKLESIGFHFDTDDWDRNYERLVAFHKKEGHTDVPESYQPLCSWVKRQRKIEDNLSEDQVKKLDDLGFTWEAPTDSAKDSGDKADGKKGKLDEIIKEEKKPGAPMEEKDGTENGNKDKSDADHEGQSSDGQAKEDLEKQQESEISKEEKKPDAPVEDNYGRENGDKDKSDADHEGQSSDGQAKEDLEKQQESEISKEEKKPDAPMEEKDGTENGDKDKSNADREGQSSDGQAKEDLEKQPESEIIKEEKKPDAPMEDNDGRENGDKDKSNAVHERQSPDSQEEEDLKKQQESEKKENETLASGAVAGKGAPSAKKRDAPGDDKEADRPDEETESKKQKTQ